MARPRTISDAELLATARRVFVERGFAASTREIARRAGVSEGVLFQRYATKSDLFFAAMVLPSPDLARLFSSRGSRGLPHLERIAEALTGYFRSITPVLLPLMNHPGFRFEEFVARHPNSPLDALRRDLVAFFVAEREAGRIGEVDPGAAALSILALAQTIAFFEQMGAHHGKFPPALLQRAVRCVWDGLAPRTPARATVLRS